jgi:hypothetical protein
MVFPRQTEGLLITTDTVGVGFTVTFTVLELVPQLVLAETVYTELAVGVNATPFVMPPLHV